MTLPTISEVTNKFLYDSVSTPTDLTSSGIIDVGESIIPVSLLDYMNPVTGPGRFALPSEFNIIELFFEDGFAYYTFGALDEFKDPETTALT